MKQKGFTLVELLVVIAIIASIVALAVPNYLGARQRAKDSKKKEEMTQLKNALRLYYNDNNRYPSGVAGGINGAGNGLSMYGCGTGGSLSCATTCTPSFAVTTASACDMVYMKQFPTGFLSSIFYYQTGTPLGEDFCLRAVLDNTSDPDIAISQSRCASSCGANCTGSGRYCVCAD